MAEIVSSAIVGEAVSRIFSGIATSTKGGKKTDREEPGGGLERLEMARIKMEAAVETSGKWQITDVSLLRWRKKLKRAAQECEGAARRCRQLSQEQDEAEQVVRQSSFPRRIAHATKAFISSVVGRDNDHHDAGTAIAVRRFERLADGASEFTRFVQLGRSPQRYLFFDPLIGHMFSGKALKYQVVHPGGPYQYFTVRPTGYEERGLEATLSFMYEDFKVPKNSFGLVVKLRLSESTDIIGTTVKCLRLVTPHFKSTADVVIKEITQLPTQDFSNIEQMEHWNHVHRILTGWFRPDPLCCQGYEHDIGPSCHSGSDNGRRGADTLRLSSIFPEPVCEVFLQCQISLYEYGNLSGSTSIADHDVTSSLESSAPLKLAILFLPHDSLEVNPESAGSAIEVIDGKKQHHLTHANVHPDQLDEMLLPKAMEYLHHNCEATTYQICWRSSHGSAHLCVEKTSTERMLGTRRVTRQGRNNKNIKGLHKVQQEQETRSWKQIARGFLKLWVVTSSDTMRSSFTTWLELLGHN